MLACVVCFLNGPTLVWFGVLVCWRCVSSRPGPLWFGELVVCGVLVVLVVLVGVGVLVVCYLGRCPLWFGVCVLLV